MNLQFVKVKGEKISGWELVHKSNCKKKIIAKCILFRRGLEKNLNSMILKIFKWADGSEFLVYLFDFFRFIQFLWLVVFHLIYDS